MGGCDGAGAGDSLGSDDLRHLASWDRRGSWHEGRLIEADVQLEDSARALMSADAVVLSADEQQLVANQFGDVVREHGYEVWAATVQATHTHLVLAAPQEDLKNVIARLKRRASMAVLARRRELAGANDNGGSMILPRGIWTAGKFPVFILDERHLWNAIEYVREHNCRKGLGADPYDWITQCPLLS